MGWGRGFGGKKMGAKSWKANLLAVVISNSLFFRRWSAGYSFYNEWGEGSGAKFGTKKCPETIFEN
jgi:hypothetical protein